MSSLWASIPLVLVLVLMIVARWPAAFAGLAGLALALVLAYSTFGLGTAVLGQVGPAVALVGAVAEALFTAATILWIIFPALAIYEMQTRSGAVEQIRLTLTRLSADRRTQALFIALFFGTFMEGAAGFGTPVALGAPLLVSIGYTPLRAVVLALIGHAAGVSFGAVGTPVIAQSMLSGVAAADIARETAILHAVLGPVLVAFLYGLAGEGLRASPQWKLAGLAAACFFGPFVAFAILVGPELPSLGGAFIGAIAFAALLRRWSDPSKPAKLALTFKAGLPYAVVLVLVLITRLIPAIREHLLSIEIGWSLESSFAGSMQPLYHPGTMLLLGFALGGILQGRSASDMAIAAGAAMRHLLPVAAALVAMLALSRVMVHSGMIHALAAAAANTGWAWPIIAPAVGVLGTFVTGSATASNILFAEFQTSTAAALGLPRASMLAAQGFGAAIGNAVCPHNIIAGFATVRLRGREGEAIAHTGPASLIYVVAGGVLVLLLIA